MKKKQYILPQVESFAFRTDLLKVTGPGTPGIDPAPKRRVEVF
jgi:hypothetical protein